MAQHHELLEIIRREIEARGIRTKRTSNGFTCRSPFREDRNPSFSVFVSRNGSVLGYDFALGKTYTAKEMLLGLGWSEEEVRRELSGEVSAAAPVVRKRKKLPELPKPVSYATPPSPTPESEERVAEEYSRCVALLSEGEHTEYLESRCLKPDVALSVGLGVNEEGEIVIPTFSDDLTTLVNLQIRATPETEKAGKPRYRYFQTGVGSGVYHSGPKPEDAAFILLVEGPINAAIASAALRQACVIGFPGASTSLTEALARRIALADKPTFITSDLDDAGVAFREKVVAQLVMAGMDTSKLYILTDDNLRRDFNEILEDIRGNLKLLGEIIIKRMSQNGKVTRRSKGVARHMAVVSRVKGMAGTTRDFQQRFAVESRSPALYMGKLGRPEQVQAVESLTAWVAKKLRISFNDAARTLIKSRINGTEAHIIIKLMHGLKLTKNEARYARYSAKEKGLSFIQKVGRGQYQVDTNALQAYLMGILNEYKDFFADLIRRLMERIRAEREAFYARYGYLVRWKPPVPVAGGFAGSPAP